MPEEQSAADIRRGLNREQKTAFVLLLIFAVVGLTLGILEIRNTVFGPFALNNRVPSTLKDEVNSIDAEKYRDTDNDGLSDYDERYVYLTNPFNGDTYSYGNGITDKDVIERGMARCPNGGKNCVDESTVLLATTTMSAPELPTDLNSVLGDPGEVRKLLIQSGMEPEILEKVSDQDLMVMVAQLLASTSTIVTSTR